MTHKELSQQSVVPRRRHRLFLWTLLAAALVAGGVWALAREDSPLIYGYEVLNTFPHDPAAYCQGLVIEDAVLYEGTGLYGESSLRKVELESGRILQLVKLQQQFFGEGITLWEDKILQLTWRNEIGIVYDRQSLAQKARFRYTGQGWGLTYDGHYLILSDGSATLRFLDPRSYRVHHTLTVRSQGRRIQQLNELEFVEGQIFANVWHSDRIACISPRSGEVTAWIDLQGLLPDEDRGDPEAVLNGIAYDNKSKRLFVTGKNWPKLFEIRVKTQ